MHLASAEAALMLIESLMLLLIDRGLVTTEQIVDSVGTALATKQQFVADGVHPEIAAAAAGLLTTMANSLAAAQVRVSPPLSER